MFKTQNCCFLKPSGSQPNKDMAHPVYLFERMVLMGFSFALTHSLWQVTVRFFAYD